MTQQRSGHRCAGPSEGPPGSARPPEPGAGKHCGDPGQWQTACTPATGLVVHPSIPRQQTGLLSGESEPARTGLGPRHRGGKAGRGRRGVRTPKAERCLRRNKGHTPACSPTAARQGTRGIQWFGEQTPSTIRIPGGGVTGGHACRDRCRLALHTSFRVSTLETQPPKDERAKRGPRAGGAEGF